MRRRPTNSNTTVVCHHFLSHIYAQHFQMIAKKNYESNENLFHGQTSSRVYVVISIIFVCTDSITFSLKTAVVPSSKSLRIIYIYVPNCNYPLALHIDIRTILVCWDRAVASRRRKKTPQKQAPPLKPMPRETQSSSDQTYGALQLRSALLGLRNLNPKPFRLLRCSRTLSLRPLVLGDLLPEASPNGGICVLNVASRPRDIQQYEQ